MKAIMITIKTKWCRLIESGDKTIEVRTSKALAKAIQKIIDEYGKCLIVVCESGTHGKVPFQFWCDKVEEIEYEGVCYRVGDLANTNKVARMSCLDFYDLKNYLGSKNGYAIHISKLEILDKPKKLSEFHSIGYEEQYDILWNNCCTDRNSFERLDENYQIKKAPQNFAYINVEEN